MHVFMKHRMLRQEVFGDVIRQSVCQVTLYHASDVMKRHMLCSSE